jgi:hypothetical protein
MLYRNAWALLWIGVAVAQESPILENTGQPIQIPFQCTEQDMQWAGLSCTDREPCPVYLELATAEPLGDKIFAAGNLHTDTVTLYAILLGSEDAGKTWREVHPRIPGAGLDHIQFTNLLNGWISGESLFPLPADPFFLITGDGGRTWRQQPLFSESRPGSIQQFYFSSKTLGNVIVDQGEGAEEERYALYESPDGGDSWLVKQMSNRPIPLPHPAEPEAGWRIQADRATESFRIEHRQADRWFLTAAFAIRAGSCKPAPIESQLPDGTPPEPAAAAKPLH